MKTMWALLVLSTVMISPLIAEQNTTDVVWGNDEEELPVKEEAVVDGAGSTDSKIQNPLSEDDVD